MAVWRLTLHYVDRVSLKMNCMYIINRQLLAPMLAIRRNAD
jgi:hypothetical protein